MTSSVAAIHVAKKQLGLDDDTYRAKLTVITGKPSVKDMTEAERQKVLSVLRGEGFAPAPGRRKDGRLKLSGKYAGKLQSLWIAAWNLGLVDNRDDKALLAFVERQTGVAHVRFLHNHADATKAIEGLKAWIGREGKVAWNPPIVKGRPSIPFGELVAIAQWALISPSGRSDFWPVVCDLLDQDETYRSVTDAEWIRVMNRFGETIRTDKRARGK